MKKTYENEGSNKKSGVAPAVAPKRRVLPRGSLYKHPKTGGYYLKIRWPGDEKTTRQSLVPVGKKTATKNKSVALAIAKRMISARLGDSAPPRSMEYWLDEFEGWNKHTAAEKQTNYNKAIAAALIDSQAIGHPGEIA